MPLSSLFKGYAGKIVRRRSTNNKPCRCCYSSSSSTKLFSRFVARQFHSSHALGFAELSDVWQGRNDKFVVESTISEHRRSLREKLKRSDGGVSKQILVSRLVLQSIVFFNPFFRGWNFIEIFSFGCFFFFFLSLFY